MPLSALSDHLNYFIKQHERMKIRRNVMQATPCPCPKKRARKMEVVARRTTRSRTAHRPGRKLAAQWQSWARKRRKRKQSLSQTMLSVQQRPRRARSRFKDDDRAPRSAKAIRNCICLDSWTWTSDTCRTSWNGQVSAVPLLLMPDEWTLKSHCVWWFC